METFLTKIGSIIIAGMMAIGSIFSPAVVQAPPVVETPPIVMPSENISVGATLPQATGVFQTTLGAPISASATSMTLSTNAVRGGGAVAGYTCYTIDEGSAQAEVVCGTTSGTAVTSMTRGISYADGTTSVAANKFAHRRGASVKITDFPILQILKAQANGDATFPNALKYETGIGPSASSDLADKEYVLSVVSGGAVSFEKVVVSGTAGETLAAGELVYLKSSDSRWWKTDADTASTVENVILGISQGTGTAGNSVNGGVLVSGIDSNQTGLSANTIYYAGNTAGALSSSAGTKEVTIGVAISTTSVVFSPKYNQDITEDIQDALAGTAGTPSSSNPYATKTTTDTLGRITTIQLFTGSGTWTKPTGLVAAQVIAIGGGGGGGRSNTTSNVHATGGGGGGRNIQFLNASLLGATESVTVGTGGAGATSNNSSGSDGGFSSFGAFVKAYGGVGGSPTVGGNGGVGGGAGSAQNVAAVMGGGGGGQGNTAGGAGGYFGAGGGGSGGTNSDPAGTAGGAQATRGTTIAGGVATGSDSTGEAGHAPTDISANEIYPGAGGGGGGNNNSGTGGIGGAGGKYGGGGGGGGNGSTSGNGGAGAIGVVAVIEYY